MNTNDTTGFPVRKDHNMCGRFYIEIEETELKEIVDEVEKNMSAYPEQITIKFSGEIFPTNTVAVQTAPSQYQPMKWGFAGFDGKPIINARSETALQKPMFREAMWKRRCLIPASGYYEWKKDSKKTKYRFFVPNEPLYLAGCYRAEKDNGLLNFVILTRQAENGAEAIHDRMPVIVPKEHRETWFRETPDDFEYEIEKLVFEAV
ncbi:MAG: SOS response-associated peptidase [Peptococcaceae bacterium]|nr:SOS response-associated peptidase [Peptococcaceae bacterium]